MVIAQQLLHCMLPLVVFDDFRLNPSSNTIAEGVELWPSILPFDGNGLSPSHGPAHQPANASFSCGFCMWSMKNAFFNHASNFLWSSLWCNHYNQVHASPKMGIECFIADNLIPLNQTFTPFGGKPQSNKLGSPSAELSSYVSKLWDQAWLMQGKKLQVCPFKNYLYHLYPTLPSPGSSTTTSHGIFKMDAFETNLNGLNNLSFATWKRPATRDTSAGELVDRENVHEGLVVGHIDASFIARKVLLALHLHLQAGNHADIIYIIYINIQYT